MGQTKHDRTAERIARKEKITYNEGQGPDIQTSRRAIEVETANSVHDGMQQLQGFQKAVYIAGTDRKATEAALEATEGTTVGVMSHTGRIVKRSTRSRR